MTTLQLDTFEQCTRALRAHYKDTGSPAGPTNECLLKTFTKNLKTLETILLSKLAAKGIIFSEPLFGKIQRTPYAKIRDKERGDLKRPHKTESLTTFFISHFTNDRLNRWLTIPSKGKQKKKIQHVIKECGHLLTGGLRCDVNIQKRWGCLRVEEDDEEEDEVIKKWTPKKKRWWSEGRVNMMEMKTGRTASMTWW